MQVNNLYLQHILGYGAKYGCYSIPHWNSKNWIHISINERAIEEISKNYLDFLRKERNENQGIEKDTRRAG